MKRNLNILIAVAAVALVAAMLTPVIEAQCNPARKFASRNLAGADATGERIRCSGWTCETDMNAGVGQAFCSQNINTWSGNPGCPIGTWMTQAASGPCGTPRRCINADIGSAACQGQGSCPTPGCDLTLFYEDLALDGTDAGFFTYRVDETPAAGRTWDYARLRDGAVVLDILPYPVPDVLMSSRPTPTSDVDANILYLDLSVHYESAGPAMQATGAISEWDVYQFIGGADPGRLASSWTKVLEIPFANSSAQQVLTVNCMGNTTDNAFLAIGATITDDAGNEFESTYVGKSVEVECDPDLANPDRPTTIDKRVRRPQTELGQRGSQKRGR